MMKTSGLIGSASALALLGIVNSASSQGASPEINYTISGSQGDWILDFTVKSDFVPSEGSLYFFGVKLPVRDIAGSPLGWDSNAYSAWNNSFAGGSTDDYNNVWITSPVDAFTVAPGASLSGFIANDHDAMAPATIQWFAYGAAGTYAGSGFFGNPGNPGFEGIAQPSVAAATPEGGSLLLFTGGLVSAGIVRLQRHSKQRLPKTSA